MRSDQQVKRRRDKTGKPRKELWKNRGKKNIDGKNGGKGGVAREEERGGVD